MSFEIKYDKNGEVIKPEKEPTFAQATEPQPEQQEQSPLQELEAAPEESEQPVEQKPQLKEESAPSAPQESFRELRLKAEQAQRERDELMRRLIEVESKKYNQPAAQEEQVEQEEELSIAPDELAEGKHLSKVALKIKRLEDKLKKYETQNTAATTEIRLKAQYPDFDNVVSKDNIELLKLRHPELAATLINSSADLYSKGVSAYSLIKNMGIAPEVPVKNYDAEKALAQKNMSKPRSSISLSPQQGESPLHRANAFANGLTEDLKAQLRREMEEARRNR